MTGKGFCCTSDSLTQHIPWKTTIFVRSRRCNFRNYVQQTQLLCLADGSGISSHRSRVSTDIIPWSRLFRTFRFLIFVESTREFVLRLRAAFLKEMQQSGASEALDDARMLLELLQPDADVEDHDPGDLLIQLSEVSTSCAHRAVKYRDSGLVEVKRIKISINHKVWSCLSSTMVCPGTRPDPGTVFDPIINWWVSLKINRLLSRAGD